MNTLNYEKMKYKTLFYDVTAFANRLPDDCLQIIAKYAYDESRYLLLERIPKINTLDSWRYVRLYLPNKKLYTIYHSWYYYYDNNSKRWFWNISNFVELNWTVTNYHETYELRNECWKQGVYMNI